MFLHSVSATDPRFKGIQFQPGLNILVASRTEGSQPGDSRNSTGKSSLIRVIRFLLGGNRGGALERTETAEHIYRGVLQLGDSAESTVLVERPAQPQTVVRLRNNSWDEDYRQVSVNDWIASVGNRAFRLPDDSGRLTSNTLFSQLIRYYFGEPTKTFQQESGAQSSLRLGYFLGFSPSVLSKAVDYAEAKRQLETLQRAARSGALEHLSVDEGAIRAQLATLRGRRDRSEAHLRAYRVDEQYADHQARADELSQRLQKLNEAALALRRRQSNLLRAIEDEASRLTDPMLPQQLEATYSELQITLPDLVRRRFDDVRAFHASVIANRRLHLEQELTDTRDQLRTMEEEIALRDQQRSNVMRLLEAAMAMDAFVEAQKDLAQADSEISRLEQRLQSARTLDDVSVRVEAAKSEARQSLRREYEDLSDHVDWCMSLFAELGNTVYQGDREARLVVTPTEAGALRVEPSIDGDSSSGINSVKTYLLDMVCLLSALRMNRTPPFLAHDSQLFDSVDARQVAACLALGAQLAEEHGFQYVVTMNSDDLESAMSEGDVDLGPHILSTVLNDVDEDGGLFGFRFD